MTQLVLKGVDIEVAGESLCRALDLTTQPGECWAVLGGNGSGKTTLLHTVAGLRRCDSGTIKLDGKPLASLSRAHIAQQIGLLLQDSHDAFPATVLEVALSGRHPYLGRWQSEQESDFRLATEALSTMELTGMEQRQVQTLSGGERRRLAIATLLCQSPELFLLDEPLNHLDLRHQIGLLQGMQKLVAQDKSVVMVLHDPNLAQRYCSHALLLYGNGEWESGTTGSILTTERLSRLYQQPLRTIEDGELTLFFPETKSEN